ncbi:hypothetical protein WJ542_29785 [Paraburkholderia sp. B3]|uniref:hypothetical protein n=1 Tax=Paraburkholderia sp. B3 TaxID=3134791 RepID=UPI0039825D3B
MKAFDLACGPWTLIEDGIERYIVLNGCKPLALVLHPSQAVDLCLKDMGKPDLLDGVSIIVSRLIGPGSVSGTGSIAPMMSQDANGDQSATTRSAISAGTINVTNPGAQTQDVANLSRDTTNTNGTVANTPDVNTLLNQQADTTQAAQAAGQVVAQGIGQYADSKRDAAVTQAKVDATNGDTVAVAADAAQANQWMEGGDSRAELQAVGSALIGGLGGGSMFSAAGGALGAGLVSKLADQTKAAGNSVTDATSSSLLGNLAGNVLSGLGGALIGGTAGAATASNVDLYNQHNDKGNEQAKSDLAAAQNQASFVQYAKEFGQATLNLVPGKQLADQAQTAFANGNYGAAAALAVGSLVDAGVGILTAGESSLAEQAAQSSLQAARLSMQLSAEEAAGATAPTAITSYSNHALEQIAGRNGGIGVNQAAVNDAFSNPTNIQYVPSAYGPTFKYIGQNATVVVNEQGNVVTTWGTSAAGVKK